MTNVDSMKIALDRVKSERDFLKKERCDHNDASLIEIIDSLTYSFNIVIDVLTSTPQISEEYQHVANSACLILSEARGIASDIHNKNRKYLL